MVGGDSIPKPLLKTLLYSGLNGASLRRDGAVRAKVREAYGSSDGMGSEAILKRVLEHPILQELALFQTSIGGRRSVYLPSRERPYYGRIEEESHGTRVGGSRYHKGLLTSRILTSHEVVLLLYLVDRMTQERIGIPLSLENDGLIYLTRSYSLGQDLAVLSESSRRHGLELLGVGIPLERKA